MRTFAEEIADINPMSSRHDMVAIGASCWWDEAKAGLKMLAFLGKKELRKECPSSPMIRSVIKNLADKDGYSVEESSERTSVVLRPKFQGLRLVT